jgi:hypothetical protein
VVGEERGEVSSSGDEEDVESVSARVETGCGVMLRRLPSARSKKNQE